MSQMQYGVPGHAAQLNNYDAELFWGGDESRVEVIRKSNRVSSATTDAGNTPNTCIRKGMILGRISATQLLTAWDPLATDGSADIDSILPFELTMVDAFNVATDRFIGTVVRAPVKARQLLIKGSAFIGNAYEYLARRQLHSQGFTLDDDPYGYLAGFTVRQSIKSANYTVVATDNGTRFLADTANATFTLPAIKAGLTYEFVRVSDHNLVVTSAEGTNMIVGNNLSATSISYTTASNKIGARLRCTGIYSTGGALKWLTEVIPVPNGTGTFLTQTIA